MPSSAQVWDHDIGKRNDFLGRLVVADVAQLRLPYHAAKQPLQNNVCDQSGNIKTRAQGSISFEVT